MHVLVTGGAGFIGSHVVDSLIDMGHSVVVLDDFSGGFLDNVNKKVHTIIEASITDTSKVERLFSTFRFDYVFHIAAYAAEGLSHFIRKHNYENNLIGSVNLINASIRHRVKCFVFTSSIAVYGSAQTPMTEDTIPIPEDPYGISKYAVELDLISAKKQFDLDYIIFRPHNVYGERQNIGDPYRNVIGIFMNQIMQGNPCPVFSDGMQTRAFTYISDVAPVIANSIAVRSAYNQIFNIGADIPYTIKELAYETQKAMQKETGVVFVGNRDEVKHAFSDHGKVRKILNVNPAIQLKEGLRRTADWVESIGIRKGKPFMNLEIERELPVSWRSL